MCCMYRPVAQVTPDFDNTVTDSVQDRRPKSGGIFDATNKPLTAAMTSVPAELYRPELEGDSNLCM